MPSPESRIVVDLVHGHVLVHTRPVGEAYTEIGTLAAICCHNRSSSIISLGFVCATRRHVLSQ